MTWPACEQVATGRFFLEPLSAIHAAEMVGVLADQSLYGFTGGEPPTGDELERRYAAQCVGQSSDGSQWWLNWVIRSKSSGLAIGFVQATVHRESADLRADISWVVAPEVQGKGAATEAACAMIGWLRLHGVSKFAAFIHPKHGASMTVAKRLAFAPTSTIENGEVRWESGAGSRR
jgi:RimJ/RimL family protein N-acetyltransferase